MTALLVLVALLISCGYRHPFTTTVNNTAAFDKPVTLHVGMWKNRTNELGYEAVVYSALMDMFTESNHIVLAALPEDAEHTLGGTIQSLHFPGLAYNQFDQAVDLRAVLKVSYTLTDRRNGTTLLREDKEVREESFSVDDNAIGTRDNRNQALQTLAQDLAEEIYIRTMHLLATLDTNNKHKTTDSPLP